MESFGFSSKSSPASGTTGTQFPQYNVDPLAWLNKTGATPASPPYRSGAMAGKGPPRVSANQNLSYPTVGKSTSPDAVSLGGNPSLPSGRNWNNWGMSAHSLTPSSPGASDEHLYHTGIRPLDAGLNFASGLGGAEAQFLKETGSLLYNNNPLGAAAGLADATGLVRNVPDYVPDAWRANKPFVELGQALVTHPNQVWQGVQQGVGNWWDNLSKGDLDSRMYALGGTTFNVGAGLAGFVDPEAWVGEAAELSDAARAAKIAKYMNQDFSRAKAEYLAEPYVGIGHHFFPRRGVDLHESLSQLPFVPKTITLPKFISDSRFNVLKPSGMSRGDFYELHFKVDPKFKGTGLARNLGPGGWSGQSIGLKEYDQLGRLWHGSPASLKFAVGGGAADAGRGASWLANQQDQSGVTPNNAVSSPVDDIDDLPALTPAPQGQSNPTDAPVTSSASGNGGLSELGVWPPWESGTIANNAISSPGGDINDLPDLTTAP